MYNMLWVDDEPLALRGVRAGIDFESLGIQYIYEALDAEEAKDIFRKHSIDLAVCDIELPGESGLDLAQWINDHHPDTVIIFLTCHCEFSYAQEAVRLMAFRYLLKPISYRELQKVLEEAIQKQFAAAANPVLTDSDSSGVVERTIAYIRKNLTTPITREDLGKNVFLNSNYLARIFKEQTGQSLFTYIANMRLEQASLLLKTTQLPIVEICGQVGIEDCSYFSRLFKRKYGMTPRQYRSLNHNQ